MYFSDGNNGSAAGMALFSFLVIGKNSPTTVPPYRRYRYNI